MRGKQGERRKAKVYKHKERRKEQRSDQLGGNDLGECLLRNPENVSLVTGGGCSWSKNRSPFVVATGSASVASFLTMSE